MSAGLYIHIPFCLRKCPYCDFYSLPFEEATADAYVRAVCAVMEQEAFSADRVDTIYFGGGTPSLMGAARLGAILDHASKVYHVDAGAEITLEANPTTAEAADFAALRMAGFNRISLGVQSLSDRELILLGRSHTAKQAQNAILSAYKSGFDNLSADLMLGIPEQTEDSLAETIAFLGALPLSHISAYMLKVEEDTPFFSRGVEPDDDLSADLYLQCIRQLSELGFSQYEISNFAKPGRESRHNLKYWLHQPYMGIGPAAHSFLDNRRFYFQKDLAAFLKHPMDTLVPDGPGGGFAEYAMLRLRLIQGLDLQEACARFPFSQEEIPRIKKRAEPLVKSGHVQIYNDTISLTPEGFLLSNTVTAALLF